MEKEKLKFIDLFSGIGGFHQAMLRNGGECVFASEIDPFAIETYNNNYKINCDHNIRDVDEKEIPKHDVLCAGFPCQTFSKAGNRKGFADEIKGTLFFEIARILKYHKTKYILLENVRNLLNHDNGHTYKTIVSVLKELGYRLPAEPIILSPHQLGIPQNRERIFFIGKYDPENIDKPLDFEINKETLMSKSDCSIYDIIDKNNTDEDLMITDKEEHLLQMWNDFYQGIEEKIIGFPIWVDFFKYNTNELDEYPMWKQKIIIKNINLYQNNKTFINKWLNTYNNLSELTPTQKKMEWQAGNKINSIYEGIIQFRPSGIRVSKPDCFPALVAIIQNPIIGKYKRRLSVIETAKLQGFDFKNEFKQTVNNQQSFKQLGNSVNIDVVDYILKKLLAL